jgi:hypothetical protein
MNDPLSDFKLSLLVTALGGKLVVVRDAFAPADSTPNICYIDFVRPTGCAKENGRLALGSTNEIWEN